MRYWVIGCMVMLGMHCISAELDDGLYATFDTSMGGFTCRLDFAEAPLTCANFVGLTEGTQAWISTNGTVKAAPFYDGRIFHRIIDGFMIQGGCPLGTGTGGPGYHFPDEFSTNLTHHSAGILSMANSGDDSNGSQFFITLEATAWLDGVHSVFGEVVDGMNVVSNIGSVEVDSSSHPLTDVVINSVRILRIGTDAQNVNAAAQPLPKVMPLPLQIENTASNLTLHCVFSNQCAQTLYHSTNLNTWNTYASDYRTESIADWSTAASTNCTSEFFRGARVIYPQAVTQFANMAGRTLVFTQGSSVLTFTPTGSGASGNCTITGTDDTLSFWTDWTDDPFLGIAVFGTGNYSYLKFELSLSGDCEGYQYKWNGLYYYWQDIGPWELTETPGQ